MLINLSIVIPAKFEAENLKILLPIIKKICSDVIVIDGHSNDGTEDICKINSVRFYLDNNLGKGDAQKIGANYSLNENIIFFDADGSHDIEDIKKIYYYLNTNLYEIILTSRKTGGTLDTTSSTSIIGLIRSTGCDLLTLLFNKLFKTKFTDILYSYKGVKKKNFLILNLSENGFGVEIEILAKSVIKKFNIFEIESREKKRVHGKSKLSTIVGVYFIFQIIKYYFNKKNFFNKN